MKIRHLLAAVLVCIAAICAPASAQRQLPDKAGPEALRKFHEQHRYTFLQLLTMATEGLVECERWKSTAIRADQAKKILSVIQSLKAKPRLSQDQARSSIRDLHRVMDHSQAARMDRAVREAGQRVMRLQSDDARRKQSEQRPSGSLAAFDPARMKNFNPFCPSMSSPRYQSDIDRNYKLVSFLQSRAQGRSARLSLSAAGPPLYW